MTKDACRYWPFSRSKRSCLSMGSWSFLSTHMRTRTGRITSNGNLFGMPSTSWCNNSLESPPALTEFRLFDYFYDLTEGADASVQDIEKRFNTFRNILQVL